MPDIFVAKKDKPSEVDKLKTIAKVESLEKPVERKVKSTTVSDLAESKGGSLSAYIANPENMHFDTQEDQEHIILLLRRHWVTNLGWMIVAILLILAPIFIFPTLIINKILPSIPANFTFVLSLGWYLVTFGFILLNFINWYFNVYIISDERIIDVDFINLLYKQMSSARVGNIQDITYKSGGLLRAFFDFGDVFIQTAGTEPNFDFEAVPHPEQVVRIIGELTEKHEESL
ncbi:MAG: hypothetical protein V1858_01575 [Candidatus Gottesmanbacteria bacterium]